MGGTIVNFSSKPDAARHPRPNLRIGGWSQLTRIGINRGVVLLLIFGCFRFANGSCDSCLAQLSRNTSLYDRISVVDSNNISIRGTLISIDIGNSSLTLSQYKTRHLLQYDICRDNVSQLGFRKRGKPNLYLTVAGFFAGQIVGKLVENIVDPSYKIRLEILPFRRPIGNEDGTWAGAIAGLGVGLLVPMLIPSERSIPCAQRPNSGKK